MVGRVWRNCPPQSADEGTPRWPQTPAGSTRRRRRRRGVGNRMAQLSRHRRTQSSSCHLADLALLAPSLSLALYFRIVSIYNISDSQRPTPSEFVAAFDTLLPM
ncbi:hypothetical protein MA16_Dca003384 [Dendrobium catenatum]|uniref:Uncharacterized protein n=1 Tax=Dendrobium catenatum TaxID=906689 RepID=A0A2I0XCL6_9ASPA|nr:hypothetical protein MA16_Dca003384 [Dendrobium catenatum]